MELVTITEEIHEASKRLADGSKKLFELAKTKAEKERDYRQALAKEIVRLKDEKTSVTLIPDIARGTLSELKFERDIAEARWTSARDSLEAIKTQMSGLQTILKFQSEV